MPRLRPRVTESGLTGAAIFASLATGAFATPTQAVECFVKPDRLFEPDASRHRLYREKHAQYRQLYPALRPLL